MTYYRDELQVVSDRNIKALEDIEPTLATGRLPKRIINKPMEPIVEPIVSTDTSNVETTIITTDKRGRKVVPPSWMKDYVPS